MTHTLMIDENFYWVGALDPSLRTFYIVMTTAFGTTYNAYLLKTTKGCILFETVKDKYFETYLENIQSLVSLEDIFYIVVNHTEPDHAGSVAKLLTYIPHATVVGSATAIKFLKEITNQSFKSLIVKDADTLTLGEKTIRFLSVPQLHWPDSMYSYIEESQILVTCDSFGAHYADKRILKSELEPTKEKDYLKAYQYYFDMIMGPFKPFVLKALDKICDLKIKFICPGHGMILDQTNLSHYMELYRTWSQPAKIQSRIVIAFVSAYGYTQKMAEAIANGIQESDYAGQVELINLETTPMPLVLEKINDSEGLLLGSPTILADALPPIWQILTSLNPVIHKSLHVGCFGSYGWSGEGVKHMAARLEALKCPMPVAPLSVCFSPNEAQLADCKQFGNEFANALSP